MTESQQTGPGTWHQRKERTNKQIYHLTFSLLKSSLPLFPGWPRCWEGGILCCEGGSLKWSDVLVLGTSLRSPNKPYSAVTAAGDNVQHGRAWPCGGSSSGIRSGPATSCSRKDGSINLLVGVRKGMSIGLVSYLDVITWEAQLLVPGSPLPILL